VFPRPRKPKPKERIRRTQPSEFTRQQIADGERIVIRMLYRYGYVDYGRTNRLQGTINDEPVFSDRKRYIVPDTDLRATVGPRITYIYRWHPEDGDGHRYVLKLRTPDIAYDRTKGDENVRKMLNAAIRKVLG
jgi:hypothetical protein